MHLTTHTDYALRLLMYLASHPAQPVSTREVASAYNVSLNHLTKVAKSLTKAGWVLSTRGGGGGLMLAPHTLETRVGEIVRYTEASQDIVECFDQSTNLCPITGVCRLKPIIYRARKAFFDVLDESTVQEIARNAAELNEVFDAPRGGRRRK